MKQGIRMAPSRQNKKQIIAFLKPNQAEAAYAKAAADDKTNQEIIGEALNAVFAYHGMPPPVPSGHRRIVRRTQTRATVRDTSRGPTCRVGRQSFGGWFEEPIVRKVHTFASEFNLSIQSMVELGLQYITGVEPDPEPEDIYGEAA